MKIEIKRHWFTTKSTVGELLIDGVFFCYTLEDVARAIGVKIYGKTAIPAGAYKMDITDSTRFEKPLPLLYNKPDLSVTDGVVVWKGTRMHSGNTEEDTDGCVLIAATKTVDFIGTSVKTMDKFMMKMAYLSDPIDLIITNEQ